MADDLDSRVLESERALGENQARLARLQGRVEAAFDGLADDTGLVDILRARAWLRHDPELRITQRGEKLRGVPAGWPPSVPDPEAHVGEYIAERRETYMERVFGRDEGSSPPNTPSPSVARFRELIGGGS